MEENYKLCGPSNTQVITNVIDIHLTKVHNANKDYIGWKVSQASLKKGEDVGFFARTA